MKRNIIFAIIVISIIALGALSIPTISANNNGNDAYVNEVLKLVNNEREKANLKPLILDKDMISAAEIRVKELNTLFSHTRPNGKPYSVLSSKIKGENIAKGQRTPQEVMYTAQFSWMKSEGHRNNILNPKFTTIGIAYIKIGNDHYWVQLFGENKVTTKPSTPSLKVASGKKKINLSWKKVPKANGYQIYKSTTKKGKYTLKKTIKSGSTIKFTDKGLKKGKIYYYKIRSYTIVNNVKNYSTFSTIKGAKVK
ncbi:CAP domain-containing protein [Methanobrevibacter sp. TMH8]|uniref:CAP domain-containing protein n=1 Tax=Methanobrevibacter sp. TMH8 TaxID=2848611 RepID=UPI001CD0200C|nr:CAP domain-containing protein [Methanobrevibacter sp. TMH8]MBZ9570925.1 CAP domain-containing protein [Methanobrevibacter sp. TMH8]